jgi:hypothetical protein
VWIATETRFLTVELFSMSRAFLVASVFIVVSLVWSTLAERVCADSPDRLWPFLLRVEGTKWPNATRNPVERIKRNEDGEIVTLLLDGVHLEPSDLEIVWRLDHLERLSLNATSITDEQLAALTRLPRLQGLQLNRTGIGNEGVAKLATFPKLKSVCLGGVRATNVAVQALKRERPRLSIGYYAAK